MANKRQLKKHVRYVCGDLAAEILIASHMLKGFDRKEVTAIVGDIATLQTKTLQNASFAFDKAAHDYADHAEYRKARRKYFAAAYKKLLADFNESVLAIVKKMNAAMPQEVKDANKA